jgi:hypothetical protein
VAQGLALMATALSKAGAPNASTLARHLYNYLRLGDKVLGEGSREEGRLDWGWAD